MNESGNDGSIKYIYEIENIITKRKYIGQTIDWKSRKRHHFRDLNAGIHKNDFLQEEFNKYGKENFVFRIIEECLFEFGDERETYYIEYYNSRNPLCGYNIRDGGLNNKQPEYSKSKISKSAKKGYAEGTRKVVRCKNFDKLKESSKKRFGKENFNHKEVICYTDKKEFDCILSAAKYYGIHRSQISASANNLSGAKGKLFVFKDEIDKLSDNLLDYLAYTIKEKYEHPVFPNSKKVLCVTTGEIFESSSSAARKYNIDNSSISKCCRGEVNYCGILKETNEVLVWEYI